MTVNRTGNIGAGSQVGRADEAEAKRGSEKPSRPTAAYAERDEAGLSAPAARQSTSVFANPQKVQKGIRDVSGDFQMVVGEIEDTDEYKKLSEKFGETKLKKGIMEIVKSGICSPASILRILKIVNSSHIPEGILSAIGNFCSKMSDEGISDKEILSLIETTNESIPQTNGRDVTYIRILYKIIDIIPRIKGASPDIDLCNEGMIEQIKDVIVRNRENSEFFLERLVKDYSCGIVSSSQLREPIARLKQAMLEKGIPLERLDEFVEAADTSIIPYNAEAFEVLPELVRAGITDPKEIYKLFRKADNIDLRYSKEIIKILPAIVRAGLVDDMQRLCNGVIDASEGNPKEALALIPHMIDAGVAAQFEFPGMAVDEMIHIVYAAVLSGKGDIKRTLDSLPNLLDAGVVHPAHIAALVEMAEPRNYGERYEVMAETYQALIMFGYSNIETVAIIKSSLLPDNNLAVSTLNDLPEAVAGLRKVGIKSAADIAKLYRCVLGRGGDNTYWIIKRLPDILRRMKTNHNISGVDGLLEELENNWYRYVKVGIDRKKNPGSSGERASQSTLDSLQFFNRYVLTVSHDSYCEVVQKLRRKGFSDKEILSLIKEAHNRYPTDYGSELNKLDVGEVEERLKALELIGIESLSKKELKSILLGSYNSLSFLQGAKHLCARLPDIADRLRLYNRLGEKDFVQFVGFLINNPTPDKIEDLVKLCLRIKKEKGIKKWSRYSATIFKHLLDPKGEKTAFIVIARSDWNGAFAFEYLDFQRLLVAGYKLEIVEVDTEDEIYEKLRTLKPGSIDAMHIMGHGRRSGAHLSSKGDMDTSYVDIDDVEWKRYYNLFSDEAEVYLHSCSTAEGGESEVNLASRLNEWLHLRVHGPNKPTSSGLVSDGNGDVKISYWSPEIHEVIDTHLRNPE